MLMTQLFIQIAITQNCFSDGARYILERNVLECEAGSALAATIDSSLGAPAQQTFEAIAPDFTAFNGAAQGICNQCVVWLQHLEP